MSEADNVVPEIILNDGDRMPQLGFGVFQIAASETPEAIAVAFEAGYRHIDTAPTYDNEPQVGQAFRASGLDRSEVFITTKCPNPSHGYEEATRACKESLERLELEHIDLYLIHWPVWTRDQYVETWRAFIDLREQGLVRSIGVSNFQPAHLERIIAETGVTPAVNQIELHPRFQQRGLRHEHDDLGIVTEAWSPLTDGAVLDDPVLTEIAETQQRTTAQVVLRWHLQVGNVVIPKSSTPERIRENFQIFDFQLSEEEMSAIEALDAGERIGPDPDVFADA